MKALITLLVTLLFTFSAQALHQEGPNINCVAIIYDDFTVNIVPWVDVADLDRGPMIKMVIFHDQGSSAGPYQTGFVGADGYAVFLQGPNLLARQISPFLAVLGVAKERLFRPDGTQTGTVTLPVGMANTAAVGANAFFTSIDTDAQSYTADTDTANAIDIVAQVGLCSPES